MKALGISSWHRVFESRLMTEATGTVSLPMKRGTGINKLGKVDGGASAYGIFISLLPVAIACVPRGTLTWSDKDGLKPHDAESLNLVTGFPIDTISAALDILIDIGWLEWIEFEAVAPSRPTPPMEDFLADMKVKLSHNGESLLEEWKKAIKGMTPTQARKVFKAAIPGINYPREFVAKRREMGL